MGELLQNFSASNTDDKWVWDGGTSEVFSVANCKSLMRIGRDASRPHNMQWEGWVPIKVNMVSWRAEFDRLPTRDALVKRRINIVDVACPLCEAANEEINHLFAGCGYSFGVWNYICRWCKLDPFFAYDFDDLLQLFRNVHGGKWRKKIVRGIVMVTVWVIWKTRNEKVFQQVSRQVRELVAEVKSFSFLWLKNRSKFKGIVWNDWVKDPLYMCN